jgi:hypothetical protein
METLRVQKQDNRSIVVTRASGSTSGSGFDFPGERISQDLTVFVLLVVGDVPIDSKASVVTSSILRICRSSKTIIGVGFACVYP